MKNLFLLLFLICTIKVHAQKSVLKENLFDSTRYWAEAVKQDDKYLIIFMDEDTTVVYDWTYKLVLDAFINKYKGFNRESITIEAGRFFYAVQANERISSAIGSKPVAGTMGFGSDYVYICKRRSKLKKAYKEDVRTAFKIHRNSDSSLTRYKHFIIYDVGNKTRITDTFLLDRQPYRKRQIIGIGPDSLTSYLDEKLNAYLSKFADSIDVLSGERNGILAEIESIHDSIEYYASQLEKIKKLRKNPNANVLRSVLQEPIQRLERETRDPGLLELRNKFNKTFKINEDSSYIAIDNNQFSGEFSPVVKYKDASLLRHYDSLISNDIITDKTMYSSSYQTQTDLIMNTAQSVYNDFKASDSVKLKDFQDRLEETLVELGRIKKSIERLGSDLTIDQKFSILKIQIDSIEAEITQTFIENFLVFGTIQYLEFQKKNDLQPQQTFITLRNLNPIGISTQISIGHAMNKEKLYAYYNDDRYSTNLSNVVSFYRPKVQNYRSDFSPADTSFTIRKSKELQSITLLKSPSQRLFEFKIFSDFTGLDGTTPNGIIQTEFSKKMFLSPYKILLSKSSGFFLGSVSYFTPHLSVSKFENYNKFFPLIRYNDTSYIPTLKVKQFESFSVGTDFNILSLTVTALKLKLYADFDISYGITGVADSVINLTDSIRSINEKGVNTIARNFNLRLAFQTDERYFIELGASLQHINLLHGDLQQVDYIDPEQNLIQKGNRRLYHIELFAGYSPQGNSAGKLFFRYRYFGVLSPDNHDGFSQIQVGYSRFFNK